jgi:hypothetical protein
MPSQVRSLLTKRISQYAKSDSKVWLKLLRYFKPAGLTGNIFSLFLFVLVAHQAQNEEKKQRKLGIRTLLRVCLRLQLFLSSYSLISRSTQSELGSREEKGGSI